MYVNKIVIKNYRAINEGIFLIDPDRTIIVGKNNVGKTSFFEFLKFALTNEGGIEFDDLPISGRKDLYDLFSSYIDGKIDYAHLDSGITLPEIEIFIDYSKDEDSVDLEAIRPAIIDLSEDISYAIICTTLVLRPEESVKSKIHSIQKSFDELNERNKTGELSSEFLFEEKKKIVKEFLINNFKSLFHSKNFAINPKTLKRRLLEVKPSEIIEAHFIEAQRPIEASEGSVFSKVLQKFLRTSDSTATVEALRSEIAERKKDVEKRFNVHLKNILDDLYFSEYPKESRETAIDVDIDFDFEQLILDSSSICYNDSIVGEKLPQKYNGLGYKNLLLMELEIASFAYDAKKKSPNSPCLLFIEEPESHMHPQLQERFVEFINVFASKLSGSDSLRPCPIIMSTHSSHIVNVVDFSKIRYLIKNASGVTCKNLVDFAFDFGTKDEKKTHLDFLRKYLELTKCDLFFADKVILVEGSTEKLYIPYVINKLAKDDPINFKLNHEYYTILEIGGAFGYLFIPFIRFLETPTLIITDIDSVDGEGKTCLVSTGVKTSNATINHWFKEELKKPTPLLTDVISLDKKEKVSGIVSIAYQIKENGFIGRTLEPAIKIANKDAFSITKEEDLIQNVDKVDFILEIVSNSDENNIPSYIIDGLQWLNKI